MGLRFRKSVKLTDHVKLNVGNKSSSVSVGVKGAHYTVSTSGRRTATVGIPGTGLSYSKTFGGKKSKKEAEEFGQKIKDKLGIGKGKEEKEAKKNAELVEDYEEQVDEVIGIHRDGVDEINWNKQSEVPSNLSDCREKVLAGDIDTYYKVIEEVEPFEALLGFGSEFEIGTDDPEAMEVEFNIKAADVMPSSKVELNAKGQAVEKELTKTEYYEIYQDYVCSVSIRLARDIFALLPVKKVLVNAVDVELNTATGNDEEVTYLSVLFDRDTFEKINLDKIDPSDSLDNFEYNMKFAKTTGFKPVKRMEL